jgi:hypothetical protein
MLNAIPTKSFCGHILNFDALTKNKKVYFNWQIQQNYSYQRLEVERSVDSVNFFPCIIFNSSNRRLFAWDKEPLQGKSYYRLKVLDFSGSAEYSEIKSVNITIIRVGDDLGVSYNRVAGSNPSDPQITTDCKIVITDLNGHLISKASVSEFKNNFNDQPIPELPAGKTSVVIFIRNGQAIRKQFYYRVS